jgi:hypothetical protein
MTTKRTVHWWLYIIAGIVLLFILAPALISAADTLAVILGIAFLVIYGVWSWKLWIVPTLNRIRDYDEL